ncbi:hypothetical protein FJY63_07990 [Candidatus Sumerlaeota bacterium]|nr:hypothetical protein [Candidatus Sumerlaeota bacterium]
MIVSANKRNPHEDVGENQVRGDLHKVLARICEDPRELIEERAEAVGVGTARENPASPNKTQSKT